MSSHEPSYQRALQPFAYFSALYYAYAGLYSAYLPLYLKELGFATFAIALLSTVNNFTRCIGPYAWGWLGDHTGQRLFIVRVSCVLALLFSAVLFAPALLWLYFIGLLAMCLATSPMMTLMDSMLIARLHRAQGVNWGTYGRVRLWGSLGFLIVVIASGWLFEHYSIRSFGASVSVLLAILLIISMRLPPDTAGLHEERPPRVLPLLKRPVLAGFYLSCFFMVAAHTGLYVFFSLYLDHLGYSKSVIGLLWATGVVFEIGWFYFQGHALRYTSLGRLWVWACFVAVLRFALIGALGHYILILVLTSVTHFLTFAAHHTASMAFITRHFAGPLANRGMALYTTIAYGFGGIVGGLAGGKVAAALGYHAVFYLSAGFALLAALVAWWVTRQDDEDDNAQTDKDRNDDETTDTTTGMPLPA